MQVHDYSGKGVARQGDVVFFKIPSDVVVAEVNEIQPIQNKLVVLEGEMTGHHHHFEVMERPVEATKSALQKTNKLVEDLMHGASQVTAPIVRMFKDEKAVQELVKKGILTRTDLFLGFLQVEGGGDVGAVLKHQEHDGIRFKSGIYYVGRQIESAGAEERVVRD